MKKFIKTIKSNKVLSVLSVLIIGLLFILVARVTYAFLAPVINKAQTNVVGTTDTVDDFKFELGDALKLDASPTTLKENGSNYTTRTTAKALLKANSTKKTATFNYYVYFLIKSNTFTYSDGSTPEIILTVTNPNGDEITSIDGLTYGTFNGVSGFDVTTKSGLYNIANNHEITSNSSTTYTTQSWTIKITYLNLSIDQSTNFGNSMGVNVFITKKEKKLTLADVCSNGQTLSSCIIEMDGKDDTLYHHTSTLTNGAGDNSYRYAGGDVHPDYYSCKYNEFDVKNAKGEVNTSLKGDCSSVTKVTFGEQEPTYHDKSINKIITGKDTVSWDSINNKCLRSSGDAVYSSVVGQINETICTGYAYLYGGHWMIGLTVEEVGAGEETLYSPASEGVKNFVCFGSTKKPCPTDNLYRIIGVIDGKVKLIKYDYANSNLLGKDGDYYGSERPTANYYKGSLTSIDEYYWNYKNDTTINNGNGSNIWSTSLLNKINLNTNFINNIGSTWTNKIATTTWKVGGTTYKNIVESIPSVAYQKEIVAPAENTTSDSKIGLMYVSDYVFAASPSAWSTTLWNYSNVRANNWMYMGHYDWTISRISGNSQDAFLVIDSGIVNFNFASGGDGVRPSFSLSSSITYVSGSGSAVDPILIN